MTWINLKLAQKPYGFITTDENGSEVKMDNIGTTKINFGVSPMQILLMGLAGCVSIDVLLILGKQKQEVNNYNIIINATKEKVSEFSIWKSIEIYFFISGDIDEQKANRAIDLSLNKYCSVAETLRRAGAEITYKLKLN